MLSARERELDAWLATARPTVPATFADDVLARIAATKAYRPITVRRHLSVAATLAALLLLAAIMIVVFTRRTDSTYAPPGLEVRDAAAPAVVDREAQLNQLADEIEQMVDDPRIPWDVLQGRAEAFVALCVGRSGPAPDPDIRSMTQDEKRRESERLEREIECAMRVMKLLAHER